MCAMPTSLQACCIGFICDHLGSVCKLHKATTDTKQNKMAFKNPNIFLPANLAEQLLFTLCEKNKLTDETMALFDPQLTCLRRVTIHGAMVSMKGLRFLRLHRIYDLEITSLIDVTVNEIIGCLGEWTLSNLRSLNVSGNTFLNSDKLCVTVALSKLQTIRKLNVSFTELNMPGLEIITEDLPFLEDLDISGTLLTDISPLRRCTVRLKSLSMYNLQLKCCNATVSTLCDLHYLQHLDVSGNMIGQSYQASNVKHFQISALLQESYALPRLKSLDISGREEVTEDLLKIYIDSHKQLTFLGLALTRACQYSIFVVGQSGGRNLTLTGEANVPQIVESLRRYTSRTIYIQKTLYKLFSLSCFCEAREDLIYLILPGMRQHSHQLGVQMAATACLYNLSKGEQAAKIHPSCLQQVVASTLEAMRNYPSHQQLQRNALLTLCSDRILQDISFDCYTCVQLVVDCLCTFDESSMNRMSVAICSILAAKISTEQTSVLGSKPRYIRKMLQLVQTRMESHVIDITLKFTLSALWNLTDESPATCSVFLREQGLELFMTMIQGMNDVDTDTKVQVETKILGLLNNIAEVKSLRHSLMREDFIMIVRRLLHISNLDVSYFAAGIIAHLASDGDKAWQAISGIRRDDILQELKDVVMAWDQPCGEMVAYRSFSPFFPLLGCFHSPSVQLWAVWAIQHVCLRNGTRYCWLLQKEGGLEKIERLVAAYPTDTLISQISANVLQVSRST